MKLKIISEERKPMGPQGVVLEIGTREQVVLRSNNRLIGAMSLSETVYLESEMMEMGSTRDEIYFEELLRRSLVNRRFSSPNNIQPVLKIKSGIPDTGRGTSVGNDSLKTIFYSYRRR